MFLDFLQNERFLPLEYLQPGFARHTAGPLPLQGDFLVRMRYVLRRPRESERCLRVLTIIYIYKIENKICKIK